MSTQTFRAALESRLGRPTTDAETSRAYAMGMAAERILRDATGPVPRSEHPDVAVAAVAVTMVARVIETSGVLEFTDADRRELARLAAIMRPPHPFTLA